MIEKSSSITITREEFEDLQKGVIPFRLHSDPWNLTSQEALEILQNHQYTISTEKDSE